jgi:hypothetical protein
MLSQVVTIDTTQILPQCGSAFSPAGSVSTDRLLRQCLMVDLIVLIVVINMTRVFVLVLVVLIARNK